MGRNGDETQMAWGPYLRRACWLVVVGFVLLLVPPLGRPLFAVPTAALIEGLLSASGVLVVREGAQLQVAGVLYRAVPAVSTAAPALVLGVAAVLAWPTGWLKRLIGVGLVVFHTVLLNIVVLALVVQAPSGLGTRVQVGPAPGLSELEVYTRTLHTVYPVAMTFVLAATLLFWTWRVVPRPLWGAPAQAPAAD